ncbi:DUF3991 domain-containing protein [Solibaculum mannosilyticum]|uniref:DUF3991 domain-containing protein n=1 Tax=Solibaculum mannosilyticum TaxID=2780922 RepID=UPI0034BDE916
MPYIPPEVVEKAREIDLLTYLQNYEPEELVHVGGNAYCTRTHDSLKISNGKWYWFSHSVGGKSALDYLIKVNGYSFIEAVEKLTGQAAVKPPVFMPESKTSKPKAFVLPQAHPSSARAIAYLQSRGIDRELMEHCIRSGRIYESSPYHNVVFVGFDGTGKARYANLRGTCSDFKGEAMGSDKRFSFRIPADNSDTVHVFESAIDLLSYATLLKLDRQRWDAEHLLSLAGVYQPRCQTRKMPLPLALSQFLSDHAEVKKIVLRLDNDRAGRQAVSSLQEALSGRYETTVVFPSKGKDYNDCLCMRLGIPVSKTKSMKGDRTL